jgi:hypothetical protein
MMPTLYSLIESPAHPDFSALYRRLGLEHVRLTSSRKAIAELKRRPPDFLVGEFFYGYANNYAGANLSNLDVLLHSLRKYAPQAKVIILAGKDDLPHVAKLQALFDIHAVLAQPIQEAAMARTLRIEYPEADA